MNDDIVPRGPDGRPLAKVTMGAAEKIGLANYSNVSMEGWVSRYCEEKDIDQTLGECVQAVEAVIAVERQKVLDMVKGKA